MPARPERPSEPARGAASARSRSVGTPTIVAAVVAVLVVAVVAGVVLLSGGTDPNSGGAASDAVDTGTPIPLEPGAGQYPTAVVDGVVVAGGPAPRVLDVWEDALCPGCQAFEQQAAEPIARAVTERRLQVRYHLVNLLDPLSSPPGYSSAAGNAMICAAATGAFPAVHASLYAAQPGERGAGYTTDQLLDLGRRAGAGPDYAPCVTQGRYAASIAETFARARTDPALRGDRGFGTPTLLLDGRLQSGPGTELDTLLGG